MKTTKDLVRSALIAALYFALGAIFAPFSFGAVQVRVAEALTLLPIISPTAIFGVTVGCVLTNIYGLSVGANILGAADILIGSAATLIAAYLTYTLRNKTYKGLPLLAALPPVLINGLVIGGELAIAIHGTVMTPMLALYGLQVALGQFVSCYLLGIPLIMLLRKTKTNLL